MYQYKNTKGGARYIYVQVNAVHVYSIPPQQQTKFGTRYNILILNTIHRFRYKRSVLIVVHLKGLQSAM